MAQEVITQDLRRSIKEFLHNSSSELINTYLFFIEKKFNLHPVLFAKEKRIYQGEDEAIKSLVSSNKLWHETEIKIGFYAPTIDENTQRIYICPFSGKVFGDNTHPNPQDAIYDWVSKCKENTERVGGLRVKRFFVSEDPEVIKGYMPKSKPKEPITKTVYSSVLSKKLFNSKEAVVADFKKNYLKPLSLIEVQSQNSFEIETGFLAFIQKHLVEDKIAAFVEALSEYEEFTPFVEQWLE